jgi:hypothetical protein
MWTGYRWLDRPAEQLSASQEGPYTVIQIMYLCTRAYPKDSGLAAWSENCK